MLLAGLFDAPIAVSEADLRDTTEALYPEETAAIAGVVLRRRREFSAGRACARQAMERLGFAAAPIPAGTDRAPIWPEGMTGSISHSKTRCAAVVARCSDGVKSVGLDIEEASPLPDDFAEEICTPGERKWLYARPPGERGLLLKALFCAKEAAYKCQYMLSRTVFGFETISIELDLPGERFSAIFERSVSPFIAGDRITGRIGLYGDHIAAGTILR